MTFRLAEQSYSHYTSDSPIPQWESILSVFASGRKSPPQVLYDSTREGPSSDTRETFNEHRGNRGSFLTRAKDTTGPDPVLCINPNRFRRNIRHASRMFRKTTSPALSEKQFRFSTFL